MGTIISVGENERDCNFCPSSFTLSEIAYNREESSVQQSHNTVLNKTFAAELAKGLQNDRYLALMRSIQDEHSKKYGLSANAIDDLCKSLSSYSKQVNQVCVEDEKEVLDFVKEKNDLPVCVDCNDPVTKYTITVNKQAQSVAEKNSKKINVDSSVFLQYNLSARRKSKSLPLPLPLMMDKSMKPVSDTGNMRAMKDKIRENISYL